MMIMTNRRYRRGPTVFGACSAEYALAINQWNAAWHHAQECNSSCNVSVRQFAQVVPFLLHKMSEQEQADIQYWDWPS